MTEAYKPHYEKENFRFSKSSFLTYETCPFQFKLSYLDALPPAKTGFEEYADIGKDVHKQIENFYTQDVKIEEIETITLPTMPSLKKQKITFNKEKHKKSTHMKNFISFQERILTEIDTVGKDLGYFKPIVQEMDCVNLDLNIHGIIDAAYINYEDNGVVILDWKTGKVKSLEAMRDELSFYAHCWNGEKELVRRYGTVKYWGMYYTQSDYLFIEVVDDKILDDVYNRILENRKLIQIDFFPKTLNPIPCKWCGYRDRCGGNKT